MDFKVNFGDIVHILSFIKKRKSFDIDELARNVNLSFEKLLYSLTILSEVYSIDGNSFVDFEINNDENLITFDFDESLLNIQTITDLDLFKIYTILTNPKIDINNLFDNKSDLTFLRKTLKEYFNSHQPTSQISSLDFTDLLSSDELYIEYIKLGQSSSNIYKIKPLAFNRVADGDVLEAYDYENSKIKTFLIDRIINLPDDTNSKSTFNQTEDEVVVTYTDILKNKFEQRFRSEEIAIEHFIKNIDTQNVISPNSIKVEIAMRKNNLINELDTWVWLNFLLLL